MKKIWKAVVIVSVILCVIGVLCGAVAYIMGGSVDNLYQNKEALPVLEMLSPQNILNNLFTFLGM